MKNVYRKENARFSPMLVFFSTGEVVDHTAVDAGLLRGKNYF